MRKKYTIIVEIEENRWTPDATFTVKRTNDGFSSLELLGILSLTQADIREQMAGVIRPDFVKREVVK